MLKPWGAQEQKPTEKMWVSLELYEVLYEEVDGAAGHELLSWVVTARTTNLQVENRRRNNRTSLSSSLLLCGYLSLSKPNQQPEGNEAWETRAAPAYQHTD